VHINAFIAINDGVLHRVKEKRNNFSTRKRRAGLDCNRLLNNTVEEKM